MLARQYIRTSNYPPFVSPSKERELAANLDSGLGPKAQIAVEGFEFTHEEIVASSQDLGWQNLQAFLIRHEGTEFEARSVRLHCLALQLGDPIEIEASMDGRTTRQILYPGKLTILPAGRTVRLSWEEGNLNEALYSFLEPAFLETIAEGLDIGGRTAVEPAIGIDDEQLRYLALSILSGMQDRNILGGVYAEQIGRALGLQIIRRYSHFREVSLTQGGMAPFKLRKALKFIDENLECEEDISLEKVSVWVGMSHFYFARTFKQSMGVSPNSYIVARRIEKAKNLLSNSDSSIADVALQVGYASQSHFTTMFRRMTGMTPKIFRRASLDVIPAAAFYARTSKIDHREAQA